MIIKSADFLLNGSAGSNNVEPAGAQTKDMKAKKGHVWTVLLPICHQSNLNFCYQPSKNGFLRHRPKLVTKIQGNRTHEQPQ